MWPIYTSINKNRFLCGELFFCAWDLHISQISEQSCHFRMASRTLPITVSSFFLLSSRAYTRRNIILIYMEALYYV